MKLETHETHQDIYVVKRLHQQILGRPAIEALGMVVRARAISTLLNPRTDFPQLFKGLRKVNILTLSNFSQMPSQCIVRRVAIPLMQPVKEELERLERLGVIARVEQPTDWCARMVVVPKPGGKVCICVDLTKLNESV